MALLSSADFATPYPSVAGTPTPMSFLDQVASCLLRAEPKPSPQLLYRSRTAEPVEYAVVARFDDGDERIIFSGPASVDAKGVWATVRMRGDGGTDLSLRFAGVPSDAGPTPTYDDMRLMEKL